jgi:hypothetical protein
LTSTWSSSTEREKAITWCTRTLAFTVSKGHR